MLELLGNSYVENNFSLKDYRFESLSGVDIFDLYVDCVCGLLPAGQVVFGDTIGRCKRHIGEISALPNMALS